ncbi:regulatory protein RecX [Candidatus Omnitrophota bacterium]
MKARDYAYRLISYRQRSVKELSARLQRKGYSAQLTNQTVEYLRELNYLNDAEFARFWVSSKIAAHPAGWLLMRYQLKIKGIDQKIIEQTINDFSDQYDELEIARGLVRKRRRRYKDLQPLKLKKRLYDLLRRRGFPGEIIYQVIKQD